MFKEQLRMISDDNCKFVPVQFKDRFIQYLLWQSLLKSKNENLAVDGATQKVSSLLSLPSRTLLHLIGRALPPSPPDRLTIHLYIYIYKLL